MKVVSGIRPTGNIHLGNYLGAIQEWKKYPDGKFFIADLHCKHDYKDMVKTYEQLQMLGINPAVESIRKDEILSLYHTLTFEVPVGWLNRMTQFKDKSKTEDATLALLSYPVLMAADIFYFNGTHIPVGNDQLQHIEFIRDLADRCGFEKPTPIIGNYPRIMSLKDGTKKMSKSDADDYSRINVTDAPDVIRDKIMKAKSANDFNDNTPEMINLRTIYKACGGGESHFVKMKDFKEALSDAIIKELIKE